MIDTKKIELRLPERQIIRSKERVRYVSAAKAQLLHVRTHFVERQILAVHKVQTKILTFHHDNRGVAKRFHGTVQNFRLYSMCIEFEKIGSLQALLGDQTVN